MADTTFEFIKEFELDENSKTEISELLPTCFPEAKYYGRTYFKQLPHYRLLLRVDNKIVGQLAIDYRAMNLNGSLIHVFGIIDLGVHPAFRHKGFGTKLMKRIEQLAVFNNNNIDFLFLVTDNPAFYERLGYTKTIQHVSWLKINQGQSFGMGNEIVDDCYLMFRKVGNKSWEDGNLDLLGYWY